MRFRASKLRIDEWIGAMTTSCELCVQESEIRFHRGGESTVCFGQSEAAISCLNKRKGQFMGMGHEGFRDTAASESHCSRRELMRIGGLGAAAMLVGGAGLDSNGCALRSLGPVGDLFGPSESPGTDADLDLVLRATYTDVPILPGPQTRVASYQAQVLSGDPAGVTGLGDSYLGPIIRIRKGQRIRVRLINELSAPTTIHWHGLRVPPDMDGHPRLPVGPGEEFVYEFDVFDRAGTYWFHPHPDGLTGPQVYQGLAGLFLVSDDEEEAAGLPSGEFDVPLVLQDRMLAESNQLIYAVGGMMGSDGFFGDTMLVNGKASFVLPVATRAYRLRLLNGSNARVYKLAWSDNSPLWVIATDGGLLEKPVQRDYVMLAPGERVELWADFSQQPLGAEIMLQSLSFSGGDLGMESMGNMLQGMPAMHDRGGMMGMGIIDALMGMGGSTVPNGASLDIMTFRVERQEQETLTLPQTLSAITRYRVEEAANAGSPRTLSAAFGTMGWLLNGRTFEMEEVADNEIVPFGATEVWEFVNQPGTMEMIHPMHIHGVQFQILERTVLAERAEGWEAVRNGYVDEGWKDTLLLMPGETVRLMVRFDTYSGMYLYHCHNLEHEDQGMMRNYLVQVQ